MIILFPLTLLLLLSTSIFLYYSVKKNLEYMELLEEFEENFKETIETLNQYYTKIDKKSKLELFLDEPVTRELVEDIKGTKLAVKNAAEKLSIYVKEQQNENDQ